MKVSLILLLFLPVLTSAQQKYTLSGSVTDASSGEDLTGATVIAVGSNKGTATNSYGFYSISLPEGDITIRVSFIGYNTFETKASLNKDISLNIELEPSVQALGEVVVSSENDEENISSPATGVEKLDIRKIESIPVFFGEKDILKTIQLLTGISNASEGSTGFNVRGGSIGQNLILLDEAPVYSSAHLMGFFSVFNSDAIKDVTVYKGGIPALYGGRASSVVDIVMNNGNSKNFSASGGIGLVSSRLTIELPIIKDRMSFILSGRRTYADLMARTLFKDDIISDDMKFYFYDLNAKLSFTVNPRNRIFLSGYFGKDVFDLREDLGTGWGNTTGTLRWNHLFNEKLFSNTSLIYSRFDYGFAFGSLGIRLRSGIEDVSLKEDLTWYMDPDNTLKAGFNLVYHVFRPGELSAGDSKDFKIALREKKGAEGALYLQNEQEFSPRLSANYGIRLSVFSQLGPGWFYEYDENNSITDSSFYDKNRAAFPYFLPEPRLSLNYRVGERSSFKASYSRMSQFIHLLTNTTSGTPADVWLPGSNNLKPVIVDQFSAGYFRNFMDNGIETSLEAWYKDIKNTTDYEDGAEIIFNEHVESQIITGRGRGYGLELYVKKKYGEFSGWIGYTLSRTENRIAGINDYEWYPVKYDKTHDLSLVSIYKPGKRITLSAVWTYATGNAVTFPGGRYVINGSPVPFYTERNGYRMPAYHRLDFSVSLEGRNRKRFKTQWDLSVYNLYNRHNAYMISFRESETVPGATEAVRLSLFGIVPSIAYNFKF